MEDAKQAIVLVQPGTLEAARKVKLPGKPMESVHLQRLTERTLAYAWVKGELREAVDVSKHWDGDRVVNSSFIPAFAKTAMPLVTRIKDDVLSIRWA